MEIPDTLKNLYRHWEKHSSYPPKRFASITINRSVLADIEQFATKRMRIWEKKQRGEKPPYTRDPILRDFRFCNIYRELDRQTIAIHKALFELREDFELWLLNLIFYRFVCNTETVEKTGLLSFDTRHNKEVYEKLIGLPSPKFGSAYIFPISLIQKSVYPTREKFFCFALTEITQKIAPIIKNYGDKNAFLAMRELVEVTGFSFKFHFTEILIDIAYQYPELIDLFSDFYIGPGAIPVAKLISNADPMKICKFLTGIRLKSFPYLEFNGRPVLLSAENWEGICCEYRKYRNLKSGQGRRRIYRPVT